MSARCCPVWVSRILENQGLIIRTLRHAMYLQPVLSSCYIIVYVYALLAWSEDLNKTTYATVFSMFLAHGNTWMG